MINKECTIIDNSTGEILDTSYNLKVDTIEDKSRKKKAAKLKAEELTYRSMQKKYLGNFVFFIFKNINKLEKILNDNDLVKFIFLGTYVKSDGILKLDNNLTVIDKKRMALLLKINKSNFNRFYNKLVENKLIIEDENIKINLEYFYKGYEKNYRKLTGNKLDSNFTRIYINTTRELYNSVDARKHKKIAIIYKLLPYVSWRYNVLCKNPYQLDIEKIKALTIKDVINLIGQNKTNITRFKNDFYSLKYKNYKVFATMQTELDYKTSIILVNPLLYFRGKEVEELQYLLNIFEIISH